MFSFERFMRNKQQEIIDFSILSDLCTNEIHQWHEVGIIFNKEPFDLS